jgi:peptide/nickel transport system substrate-binding protein
VVFWLNLDEAEKANFGGYSRGTLPDNLVSYRATGPDQVTLHLSAPAASTWFTDNQLAEITPLPLAWDVTRLGASPGSGGCLADTAADKWARCVAVYDFLTAQAKPSSSYTGPLWSVVDGPWRLNSYSFTGYTFVPNAKYSGNPRPVLASLRFLSYDSTTELYRALRAGELSMAQVPAADLPAKSPTRALPSTNPLAAAGYRLQPAYYFAIYYAAENWNNPVYGAVFRQLYFRQALQELTNQDAIASSVYRGYAYPTVGGVPDRPATSWISAAMKVNHGAGPYPFDPERAEATLAAHGWRVVKHVLTCEVPGTGGGECGAGIAKGQRAGLSMFTDDPVSAMRLALQSDLGVAGIPLAESYIGDLAYNPDGPYTECSGPGCTWTVGDVSGWIFDGPGFEPSGELLFQTKAAYDSGAYTSPQMDALINQTRASGSAAIFSQYANYAATSLPVLFLPVPYNVVAVSNKLHDVTQSPLGTFLPEYWYLTKQDQPESASSPSGNAT